MRGVGEGRPAVCGVALKEWAGIVSALLSGRQTLLLRKGGIAEVGGAGVFRPEHEAFWLFPTFFHEESGGRSGGKEEQELRRPEAGTIELPGLATVEGWWWVDRLEALAAVRSEHCWSEEVVASRFAYRRPGLWVMAVRMYRAEEPRVVPDRPEYAGCKSWMSLGEALPTAGLVEVLGSTEARERHEAVARGLAAEGIEPGGRP